jgi:subtilisin family serine protease
MRMQSGCWQRGVVGVALLTLVASIAAARPASSAVDPASKIADVLLARRHEPQATEFLVVLVDQASPPPLAPHAQRVDAHAERVGNAVTRLKDAAERSQQPVLDLLVARGVSHRSFWVANMIWVRAPIALALELSRDDAVERIEANDPVSAGLPAPLPLEAATEGVEASIGLVGAPDVWDMGYVGQGAVVAGADTGYEWDHPALLTQYRGWNGVTANHDYAWHDAIHTGGGSCGVDSASPCDDHGHGTHTMGTMVGDDDGSNQIGMAPGARWIGCRNMDHGYGTPASYTECFQWFMAPTDSAGQSPDPAMAPHVINNSWTCPASEGCVDVDILRTVVENVRAAGILVVASAGNDGSACSTIATPPAIYDASFSVAATNINDFIAGFSSRGPVTSDGSQRLKPDISAPGVSIRSSRRGAAYGYASGTSMAGPHVAGLAALLIGVNPALAGNVPALESIIRQSAVPLVTSEGCGEDGPAEVPNHTFGHGRIDALAAVQLATPPVPTMAPLAIWLSATLLAGLGLLRLHR